MFDGGVEIDIIADVKRHAHACLTLRYEQTISIQTVQPRGIAAKQIDEPRANLGPRLASRPQQQIQRVRFQHGARDRTVEKPGACGRVQIEDVLADCRADASGRAVFRKDAVWQILHRKAGTG